MCLQVFRINHRFNVIYVCGAVPGHTNTFVRVTDARRKPHTSPPPFPTFFPDLDSPREEEEFADADVHLSHHDSLDFPNKVANK